MRNVDTAAHVHSNLEKNWVREKENPKNESLARAIRKAFGCNMYIAGVCKLFGDLLGFVGPICLNEIVKYLEDPSTAWFSPKYYGYILSFVLFVCTVLQSLLLHQVCASEIGKC